MTEDILIKNMDNNMTAIVCAIMIGLGFVNGITVTRLMDLGRTEKLYDRIRKDEETLNRLQETIDALEDELDTARIEKNELLNELNSIVGRYSLPPPPLNLPRQSCCENAEAVTPPCVKSPDVTS
jgi:hypothetical protein